MLIVEREEVYNIPNAMHGMRQPFKGLEKTDSKWISDSEKPETRAVFIIGEEDMRLAQNLLKLGTPHDKFMRQILVSMDINAPFFHWKEMDTYKVGTVTNSESTMHTILKHEFDGSMFSSDESFYCNNDMTTGNGITLLAQQIFLLNTLRDYYLKEENKEKQKKIWRTIIQALPCSYMQKRTWTTNYSVLRSIYLQRKDHKLIEWKQLIESFKNLPYAQELIFYNKETK